MNRGRSLSARILLLAVLNILLMASFFLLFARLQFQFHVGSFLLVPAKQTIASISRLIALQLPNKSPASWNGVLTQFSSRYPARFYLFDHHGVQLAGSPVQLPNDFANAVRRDPFAFEDNEGQGHPGPPLRLGEEARPPFDPLPHARSERKQGRDRDPPPRPPGGPPSQFSAGFGPAAPEPDLDLTRTTNPTQYWAGVRIPLWLPDSTRPLHATLVWQIPSLWTERFFFDYRPWLAMVLAIIIASVICWLPLIRNLNLAIQQLTTATGQIANGHFEVQLPADRHDELGRLSQSINTMARRLSGYVYGQKRFLGDIAHELSSPLARLEVGLGILQQQVTGEAAGYLKDVQEEADHMASLVSELLAFSKSQAVQATAAISPLELAPLILRVLEREGALTGVLDESVRSSPPVMAIAELLERALANVIRNAVRYAGQGTILVSAHQQDQTVAVTVSDEGPGLPEEELEDVFRPFYRPEFARQPETGGAGLGLAIVRDCIESCHGSVICRNRTPHGLEVVIRLQTLVRPFTES